MKPNVIYVPEPMSASADAFIYSPNNNSLQFQIKDAELTQSTIKKEIAKVSILICLLKVTIVM